MKHILKTAILLMVVLLSIDVGAQEQPNDVPDELSEEIAARTNDIERTTARLESLSTELLEARMQVQNDTEELKKIEARLAAGATLLYRLSKHGKALRYLLTSQTSTDFFKRMLTLRRLVISELEAKRLAGLNLEEHTAILNNAESSIEKAKVMLKALEETRQELISEQQQQLMGSQTEVAFR